MTHRGSRWMAQAAILLAVVCRAAAQTPPPPPGIIKTLYRFSYLPGATDGNTPVGGLVQGDDGNFYGATSGGDDKTCQCGTIFKITSGGDFTTVYTFTEGPAGGYPNSPMVKDRKGNIYGTTGKGINLGTAFRIAPGGFFTSLGNLPGSQPNGLVVASDGNLYGTTADFGRGSGYGTFFQLTPDGVVTLLYKFDLPSDGIAYPSALVEGSDGNFYGTSRPIGAKFTVFRITPAGKLTIVFSSDGGSDVGGVGYFSSSLTRGPGDIFYGAARDGVYSISSTGSFNKLMRFSEVDLPIDPISSIFEDPNALLLGDDGNFYGTTGTQTRSSVYQISSGGSYQLIYRFPYFDPTNFSLYPEGFTPSRLAQGPDGVYGVTSAGGGANQAGTVFKITYSDGGGSIGPGVPAGPSVPACQPAVSGKITAVDPNLSDSLRRPLLGKAAWDENVYQAVAESPATVEAFAADGVTPVILRWRIPKAGKVIFSITDAANRPDAGGRLGMLGCLTSASCAQGSPTSYPAEVQPLSDGSCMAFVRLTSPVDFARVGNGEDAAAVKRPVQIAATLTAPDGSIELQNSALFITRIPVVLLHGLWSGSSTWKWTFTPELLLCAPSYETTNGAYFGVNADKPREGIRCALEKLRSDGIAGTQVDFVGHSMGGLLARIYAGNFYKGSSERAYYRDDNLQMGDIHKLITLDTPHFGSELANVLVDSNAGITELGVALQAKFDVDGSNRCVACGAVFDLRAGSPALLSMPAVPVPSHAIVATGGQAAIDASVLLGPEVFDVIDAALIGLVGPTFAFASHDLIVTERSQAGGLTGAAVSRFGPTPLNLALHFTVTGDQRISERVSELLDAPVGSESFGRFQATGP